MPAYRHNFSWRPHRRVLKTHVPPVLWDWLLDPGSLTRRLQHACDGQFRVQVCSQGWARPLRDEARALHLRAGRYAMVREVYLLCREQPCVFARTVIPALTLRGKYRRLVRLGNRSLGAVLFADPSMRRSAVEVACLTPGLALYERVVGKRTRAAKPIWGRRSLFYLQDKPLLLSEIFLHDMP